MTIFPPQKSFVRVLIKLTVHFQYNRSHLEFPQLTFGIAPLRSFYGYVQYGPFHRFL